MGGSSCFQIFCFIQLSKFYNQCTSILFMEMLYCFRMFAAITLLNRNYYELFNIYSETVENHEVIKLRTMKLDYLTSPERSLMERHIWTTPKPELWKLGHNLLLVPSVPYIATWHWTQSQLISHNGNEIGEEAHWNQSTSPYQNQSE